MVKKFCEWLNPQKINHTKFWTQIIKAKKVIYAEANNTCHWSILKGVNCQILKVRHCLLSNFSIRILCGYYWALSWYKGLCLTETFGNQFYREQKSYGKVKQKSSNANYIFLLNYIFVGMVAIHENFSQKFFAMKKVKWKIFRLRYIIYVTKIDNR